MPIIKDGVTLKAFFFNRTTIQKVIYNGVTVFEAGVRVSWEIYWENGRVAQTLRLTAHILDTPSLIPSDIIKVRIYSTFMQEYVEVELTALNPDATAGMSYPYVIPQEAPNNVEFLVNGVVKATDSWDGYESMTSTQTGTVTVPL